MAETLIPLDVEHAKSIIQLSQAVGWSFDLADAKTLLSAGHAFGVIDDKNELIATATAIHYDRRLASLGMVIVHPNHQKKSLGKRVTKACLQSLQTNQSMICVATEAGFPLYKKLGFEPLHTVHKYTTNQVMAPKERIFRPFKKEDIKPIIELDAKATGSNRSDFLKKRFKQAEKVLVKYDANGQIIAYGVAIQGEHMRVIGPIVAKTQQDFCMLVQELAVDAKTPIRIDVPTDRYHDELVTIGFTIDATPWMMGYGRSDSPYEENYHYALAAQAYG
ncbi:GNAT family N-acetyltransferase [Geomicrobium sp. JCM 19055]|uniref:GNAT family N-acetyltransferase n=1 Tax=Geomicrobium sp. JCM 19055 TaxID=1460649 RepID=UPI00045ED4CA|nr:GNAT family N-acetyltransferase [Geomicrobium sp. JCM 19055]GAJ98496.1 acetyltransferase, GNAT family [Geomicrobium sp. JCM 19055]